ncbi:MAG: PilN domain-containing protein [Pseudomonadota bacterium]
MSQQINLFNPIFLTSKKLFSAVAMAQALSLLVLGAALMTAYAGYRLTALGKEAAATAAQLGVANTQLARVKAEYGPRVKSQALEQQIQQTEAGVQSLKQVFDILQSGTIGNTQGYSAYLRAFSRQVVEGLWLTDVSIVGAGNELALQGRALQPEMVPAYMNRLRREPVMQGKSFATLEMQVPQTGLPKQNEQAAARQPVLAGYIEFILR